MGKLWKGWWKRGRGNVLAKPYLDLFSSSWLLFTWHANNFLTADLQQPSGTTNLLSPPFDRQRWLSRGGEGTLVAVEGCCISAVGLYLGILGEEQPRGAEHAMRSAVVYQPQCALVTFHKKYKVNRSR
jgi:hypothetical protein